ncbi:MAG: hypothetical protein IIC82_07970 [Chloroflexi bacterium]|nr:hypothetical protein [Chloroflexota bacterium]
MGVGTTVGNGVGVTVGNGVGVFGASVGTVVDVDSPVLGVAVASLPPEQAVTTSAPTMINVNRLENLRSEIMTRRFLQPSVR